ncbi:ABC transporter ATP-binding protein [Gorillibacterium sp. sgz500922]|uniref:ABC transporter ATP-binding protein n=1 Tax=Gorillibacterium sp. sgz500922 TaxID=3446694 RepID=UPI003F66B059
MAEKRAEFEVRPGGMHGGPGRFGKKAEKLKNPKETLKRILRYMDGSRKALIVTFLLCVVTALISIAGTRLNGYAVDRYIERGDLRGLFVLCLLLAGIYLVGVVSTYIQNRIMVGVAQQTSSDIRRDLYRNTQDLSIGYFDTHSSGDLMSRLTNDVDNINMTLSQTISQFFAGIVGIVGMFIAMLLLSPILLLAGMLMLPLMFFLTKLIAGRTQPFFVTQQKELGRLNGFIEERISGQKVTLLFGKEEQTKEEFGRINLRLRGASIRAQALSGMMGPVNNMINNLAYFIIAVTGAYLLLKGYDMTVGVIFTFILYMRGFIQPINQLLNTFNTIQSALAGAERVFEILDEPKEQDSGSEPQAVSLRGEVALSDVGFSYIEGREILRGVSLEAEPGQTIAIVGPTGSGKTTIINLLTRFYDIDRGAITLDGRPIQVLDKRGLRRNIAMVLQDTFLFSDSVRQNIRCGRMDATDPEIEQAARIANAHRFIEQLPDGYDTVLTDNGSNLSHGQRQLVAIARAVLAEASILILDEATSSIDTGTELAIQQALINLMKGKTTFIIAHRLSTIRHADQILALDHGQIIERGTHEELMAKRGFYYELCQSQYKGIAI